MCISDTKQLFNQLPVHESFNLDVDGKKNSKATQK